MVQVGVSLNHIIKVESRGVSLPDLDLIVIDKERDTKQSAGINGYSYSNGVVTLDFDYQTAEGSSYYIILLDNNLASPERFKSMMFATDQATKTPYQNVTENNDINE